MSQEIYLPLDDLYTTTNTSPSEPNLFVDAPELLDESQLLIHVSFVDDDPFFLDSVAPNSIELKSEISKAARLLELRRPGAIDPTNPTRRERIEALSKVSKMYPEDDPFSSALAGKLDYELRAAWTDFDSNVGAHSLFLSNVEPLYVAGTRIDRSLGKWVGRAALFRGFITDSSKDKFWVEPIVEGKSGTIGLVEDFRWDGFYRVRKVKAYFKKGKTGREEELTEEEFAEADRDNEIYLERINRKYGPIRKNSR